MAAFNVLEVNEDGTEYSLTLAALIIDDRFGGFTINSDPDDFFHEDYHRTFFASPGVRYGSNTTKSSFDWYSAVSIVVHYGASIAAGL